MSMEILVFCKTVNQNSKTVNDIKLRVILGVDGIETV